MITNKVDFGFALTTQISALKIRLDEIKAALRREVQLKGGEVYGETTVAVVSPPESILRLHRHADVHALKSSLGDDFGDFFEERLVVSPRKDIAEKIKSLPDVKRDLIFSMLEQDVGVGGVSFRKR